MEVLNLYYSSTGNTEKVAVRIEETLVDMGHTVNTIRIQEKPPDLDILAYDFVFLGSGVYRQLPGKPEIEFHRAQMKKYRKSGEIKPASPKRPSKKAVVYCTYGGVHTGINEAIPAVKYMGAAFRSPGLYRCRRVVRCRRIQCGSEKTAFGSGSPGRHSRAAE